MKLNFTLPEFCFLDGNSHEGNSLEERTVIQHIRTYTILEAICTDDVKELNLTGKTYPFKFKNRYGVTENHVFALHFTLDMEENLPAIFEKCKNWYCAYLVWEDGNIIEGETAQFN